MIAKIGDKDILSSGTVVTHHGESITIAIGDEGIERLSFRFVFDQKEGGSPEMNFSLSDDSKRMNITLNNFDSALGNANSKVLPVGTFGKELVRRLYLNFAVHSISSVKVLHYTFSLGEIVDNINK